MQADVGRGHYADWRDQVFPFDLEQGARIEITDPEARQEYVQQLMTEWTGRTRVAGLDTTWNVPPEREAVLRDLLAPWMD